MNAYRSIVFVLIFLFGALNETKAQFSRNPKPYPECKSSVLTEIGFPFLSKNANFYLYEFGEHFDNWGWKKRISFISYYGFHQNLNKQKGKHPKPPLRFGKIMAQFGAGVIGGFLGNIIWVDQFENTKVKGDAGYNPTRHLMMFLSSFIGTSLGVYVIGNIGESHGSYLATALGGLLGSFPQLISIDDPYYFFIAISFGLLLQTAGSIIGFNLSREFDATPRPVGLINLKNNRVFLSVPTIAAPVNYNERHQFLSYRINIIQFNFN